MLVLVQLYKYYKALSATYHVYSKNISGTHRFVVVFDEVFDSGPNFSLLQHVDRLLDVRGHEPVLGPSRNLASNDADDLLQGLGRRQRPEKLDGLASSQKFDGDHLKMFMPKNCSLFDWRSYRNQPGEVVT